MPIGARLVTNKQSNHRSFPDASIHEPFYQEGSYKGQVRGEAQPHKQVFRQP